MIYTIKVTEYTGSDDRFVAVAYDDQNTLVCRMASCTAAGAKQKVEALLSKNFTATEVESYEYEVQ